MRGGGQVTVANRQENGRVDEGAGQQGETTKAEVWPPELRGVASAPRNPATPRQPEPGCEANRGDNGWMDGWMDGRRV